MRAGLVAHVMWCGADQLSSQGTTPKVFHPLIPRLNDYFFNLIKTKTL